MFSRLKDPSSSGDFEFTLLQETAKRLSECVIPHDVLNEVVSFVTILVKCDSVRVYSFEGGELILRASKDFRANAVATLTTTDDAAWVTQIREPIVIGERAYEDVRFKLFNESPEGHFEAFFLIPIIGGGKFLGLINAQSVSRNEYSRREIKMIGTIGFLLGNRIESDRLKRENAFLSERIETRTLVDRAKKILQQDLEISEKTAYRMMQLESQHRNKRMNEIAEAIILTDELKQISREQTPDAPSKAK